MKPETLICNTVDITYDNGYIALWCKDYDLPDTIELFGDTLLRKPHFHVSLLCVEDIPSINPETESKILQHFCGFAAENEIKLAGFTKEFRLAKYKERKSVVAMCEITNLLAFAEYLSQKIGIEIAPQPTHVTIYTLQPDKGIGLNSPAELEEKSEVVEVPEAVSIALAE